MIQAHAADSYTVDTATTREVDEFSDCQRVINNSGQTLFVPTKTATEWSAFQAHPPAGVTLAACSCADISFRSTATSTSTTSTLVIAKPAGLSVSDVMVAHVLHRQGGTGTTLDTPAGWTKLDSDQMMGSAGGSNSQRSAAYYKVATAADVAAVDFTWTFSATTNAIGGILAYRNVETADPVDDSSTMTATANINSIAANAVTVEYARDMIVALYGENGNLTYSPAAGFSERFDFANGTQISTMGSDQIQTALGSSGTITATLSGNGDRRTGKVVALRKNTLNCP